jgi:hypothetical protein
MKKILFINDFSDFVKNFTNSDTIYPEIIPGVKDTLPKSVLLSLE